MTTEQIGQSIKIVSWNLYYRKGASVDDVAALIAEEKPDLMLMQEATDAINPLADVVGGVFHKAPWRGKRYSLAAWTPKIVEMPTSLGLPSSKIPGKFPPRVAQVFAVGGMKIANVHLSHGQILNRRQLRTIAANWQGPLAIIGDYNSVGTIGLHGFEDVGPRANTHRAQKLVPLRLDRCMIREVRCLNAETREKGPSDHRPIVLTLTAAPVNPS